jgi:hypothetical protein
VNDAVLENAKLLNANQIDAKQGLWMPHRAGRATISKLNIYVPAAAAVNSNAVIRSTAVRNYATKAPAVHAGKPSSMNLAVTAAGRYCSLPYPVEQSHLLVALLASVPKTVATLKWLTIATEMKRTALNARF